MLPEEVITRGRLLTHSSTRAFAALRERATNSLARLRALSVAAFCAMAAVLAFTGDSDGRVTFWPLLAYAAVAFTVFRWVGKGGFRSRLVAFSPVADLLVVFALQWVSLAHGDDRAFGAGWTIGVYALLVGFSALSLRSRIIGTTAAISFALLAALQLHAGIHWTGIAASGVVLALVAVAASAVVRELDGLVARLVVQELRHEELRRAQGEAETLTHLIVHDMKGPLTGLIGLAEQVASELEGPLQAEVKMIEQQGRRLETMVADLLAIARLERGVLQAAPELVDLPALLTSLSNAYAASARQQGASIAASVEPGLCATLHRELLHRLIDNLVLNALDFVRPHGRIELAAWQDGKELVLAVRNTGEAIAPEMRARLFQKNASVGTRRRHNLGLGLYLCRLVAVAHDGGIALLDEPGWAASFVVRLPVEARKGAVQLEPSAALIASGTAG